MNKKIIIVAALVIIAVAFLYPKNAGGGSCGFCMANEYKWTEHGCFGFKQSYYPVGCRDCTTELLCYGIVYDYKDRTGGVICYNSSTEPRNEIPCNLMK